MCFMFPSGSNPMILYEGALTGVGRLLYAGARRTEAATHPELVKFSLLLQDLIVSSDQPSLQGPDLSLQHGVLVFCKTKKG